MPLVLYQRDDCALCDEAIDVLARAGVPDFSSIWIDNDMELEVLYGDRVPVLRDLVSGREIDWPFDERKLAGFLDPGMPQT
ncbi:MAG TPA: glutaredoxin family protein [Dokdonella sp.]|jgi:hypothetical protein|nr:glutaredoxin family protein [Dokdonella sp.]